MKYRMLVAFFIMITTISYGQNTLEDYYKSIQANEPNSENPFGQLNTNAPEETQQFAFMVGVSHCTDSILNPDGTYRVFPSIWRAKYFLNGYGIQDNNFNPVNPTTNLRVYDSRTKAWNVIYLQSANGYFTGEWEGKLNEGNEIVLTAEVRGNTSKLLFYDISEEGYSWHSETIKPDGTSFVGWIKHCIKQKEL